MLFYNFASNYKLWRSLNYFIPTHHESKRTLWNSFLSIPFNARIHRLQR